MLRLWMAAFCVGVVVIGWSAALPGMRFSIFLISLPLWLLVVLDFFKIKHRIVLICLCAFGAGAGFAGVRGWHTLQEAAPVPPQWLNKNIKISGMITGLPSYNKGLWRFTLTNIHSEGVPLNGCLKLSWYSRHALQSGQYWNLLIRVKPPHSTVSPGAFDMEAWLRRSQISGTGYVIRSSVNRCTGINRLTIDFWRNKLNQHLIRMLPGENTQLSQALLFGKKSAIPPEDWVLFNLTGTTHLLVISGLHIGLMFMLGYAMINGLRYARLLPLKYIALPRIGVISGFLMGCLYAALAGFSVPVQRSLIMLFCGCLGKLFDFNTSASTVWLTAMTVVLLFDPMAVTSNGFWYSFIAVASLLLVFATKEGKWPLWKRWWLPQWSVFIALSPLLLWYQQPSVWCSPLINMLSVPFVGLIVVPLLMVGTLISLLPGEINCVLFLGNKLLQYWKHALQWSASSWSVVSEGNSIVNTTVLLLCILGTCFLLLPRGMGWRWFGVPCLLLIWLPDVKKISKNEAEIALLDVRRSHVAVIRTRHHVAIFDMGDKTKHPRFNAVQSAVLPFLRQHKIKEIDAWILPHGLSTEVAATQLRQSVKIKQIYAAGHLLKENQLSCGHPHYWQWDGITFQLLPERNSCILTVSSSRHSALFTGNLSGVKMVGQLKKHDTSLLSDIWFINSVKPYLPNIKQILQTISPDYIALSQSDPLKAAREKNLLNAAIVTTLLPQKLVATSCTGTQYYSLKEKGNLVVDFYREKNRCWWRYNYP